MWLCVNTISLHQGLGMANVGQDSPRSAGSVMLTPRPVRRFTVHNGH